MFVSASTRYYPLLAGFLLAGLALPVTARLAQVRAQSQPPVSAPVSSSERREQLAKISEGLNSPDPLRRMATLDSVLHDNDMLSRQLATQVALGSSDATMRDYAALLILSKTQIMNLELSMPPEVQAKLDKAGEDADAQSKVQNAYLWVFRYLGGSGRHTAFQLHDFNPDTGQFKVTCQGEPKDSPTSVGQINGGSLEFRAVCDLINTYRNECAASLQLGAQGVFTGVLSCVGVPLALPATLRLH